MPYHEALVQQAIKRLSFARRLGAQKRLTPLLKASFDEGFRDGLAKSGWAPGGSEGVTAAGIATLLGSLASIPIRGALWDRIMKGKIAVPKKQKTEEFKERHGADILEAIRSYKKEHPEIAKEKIYISGKVPVSMHAPEGGFESVKSMVPEWQLKTPGVYIHEKSPDVALHELSHARRPWLPYRLLVSLAQNLGTLGGLSALAWGDPHGLPSRLAPLMVAAGQIPLLAEEAAASLQATHHIENVQKKKTEGRLLPAWLTYATNAAIPVAATAVGAYVKRNVATQRIPMASQVLTRLHGTSL